MEEKAAVLLEEGVKPGRAGVKTPMDGSPDGNKMREPAVVAA